MAKYNPLSTELVKELESIVGAKNITVDPEKMETYSHDEETEARKTSIVWPKSCSNRSRKKNCWNLDNLPTMAWGRKPVQKNNRVSVPGFRSCTVATIIAATASFPMSGAVNAVARSIWF